MVCFHAGKKFSLSADAFLPFDRILNEDNEDMTYFWELLVAKYPRLKDALANAERVDDLLAWVSTISSAQNQLMMHQLDDGRSDIAYAARKDSKKYIFR